MDARAYSSALLDQLPLILTARRRHDASAGRHRELTSRRTGSPASRDRGPAASNRRTASTRRRKKPRWRWSARSAPYLGDVIHEPACGDGKIARVLTRYGHPVIATDLVDHGYGRARYRLPDDRTAGRERGDQSAVHSCREIHRQAVPQARLVALLLKSDYWHAARRIALWRPSRPARS